MLLKYPVNGEYSYTMVVLPRPLTPNQKRNSLIISQKKIDIVWDRSSWFPWAFSQPKMSVGFIIWARHKYYLHSENTSPHNSKGGQDHFIYREGLSFWGISKALCLYWLSSKQFYYQWRIRNQFAEAAAKSWQSQTPRKSGEGVLFVRKMHQQHVVSYLNGCCAWLCFCNGWSPSLIFWFGPIWLSSVPNMKKVWVRTRIALMMMSYLLLLPAIFQMFFEHSDVSLPGKKKC